MNKIRLIMFLLLVFSTCISGVNAQSESSMSEADANEQIAHFKSAKEISLNLDTWYIHANTSGYSSKPVTRFDLVMMIHDYQNKLRDIAAYKLRLKIPEEFYAFVKKNPGYAINYPYSVSSGASAESAKAVYKDIGRNDDFYFEELRKLGVNLCAADGNCYPDRELTEKEFYEWVGKIYGVRFNNAPLSDKPVAREKMGEPLVRAIQTNFERVEKILNQMPNSSQKLEIIKKLPSIGRARISSKSFYLPDSPCADLSAASDNLKKAFEGGGIRGGYRINEGDEGDIVFETGDTCRKGRIILLRVGTAIVTMMDKGIKRIK